MIPAVKGVAAGLCVPVLLALLWSPVHAADGLGAMSSACIKLGLMSVSCAVQDVPDTGPAASSLIAGPSPVRDPAGLRRDVYYFLGWQFAIIGILYVMPESVSGWSEEQKSDKGLDDWWENVKNPVWDEDDFVINYVLHPYWGATYFVRARERGYGDEGAFWYSALLSSLYEFGVEAFFENPSIQDLVVTPVAGSVVGQQFMNARKSIRERVIREGRYRRGDRWWLVLTDPLGALNRWTDRRLGREFDLNVRPFVLDEWHRDGLGATRLDDPVYGVHFSMRW